jgi:hypothetical protein
MHDRFDRVDSALNTILNFELIDKLGIVNGNVTDIRTELVSVQTKLNRL